MNEFIENNPQLFFVFFIGMWVFICFLLSTTGGWGNLAKQYRCNGSFSGDKSYFQSLKIGLVNYSSCVTIGLNSKDLFLSVLFPFRIGHSPLKIPYVEIEGKEQKGLIFNYVNLKIKGTNIRLSRNQADKIVKASRGRWRYDHA